MTLLSVCLGMFGAPSHGYDFDNLNGDTEMLSVKCIGQDHNGMIWFGTDKGLYSYDGYAVKSFRGKVSNMQTRCILALDDVVLVGCNGGLLLYDVMQEEFMQVDYFDNDIVNVLILSGDTLYVGADSGLYRIQYTPSDPLGAISKLCSESVRTFLLKEDRLWIGTFRNYGYYSLTEEKYVSLEFEENASASLFVSTIYQENDSTLWLGTSRAMIQVDISDCKATRYLPMTVLQTIYKDEGETFLLGTDAGLMLHDRSSGSTVKLRDGVFTSSFLDRDGNYWLGTDNGLLILRKSRAVSPLPLGGLSPNSVAQTILQDQKGRLWVGGLDGIQLYEKQDGMFVPSLFFSMNNPDHRIPQKANRIVEDRTTGNVYVASDRGYLRFNEQQRNFEVNVVETRHNWIYDVLAEEDDIWLATYDGLLHTIDGKILSSFSMSDGLTSNDIVQVVRDRVGQIWFLSRDQMVYRTGPAYNAPQRFVLEDYVGNKFADYILADGEETVWIASRNELIQIPHASGKEAVRRFALPGNPEMEVYSVADIMGRIWVTTSDGVFHVDKETGAIGRFSVNKNYMCITYDPETGSLLAGTAGGVDAISIREIERMSSERSNIVYLSSVMINENRLVPRKNYLSRTLVLSSNEKFLGITFSDYQYGSDLPHRYLYRLKGGATPWREVLTDNIISLSDLKPGRYSLQISSGSPSEEAPVLLSFRIKKPGFLSWPMILLYLLFFSGLLYLFVRAVNLQNKLTVERKEREMLLKRFHEKEDFLANLSHEFKTPLSLIIAPLNKLIHDVRDASALKMLTTVHDNATKLNGLVHNALDYYRKSEESPGSLLRIDVDFVDFVRTIFESFRENYPKHEFIFSSSHTRMVISIDYVKMEMVVNNLLSNACKYTPEGGSVILTLEEDDESRLVSMKLSDTGIGIPQEDLPFIFRRYYESSRTRGGTYDSTGIGLSIIKNVVENLGGQVSAESDDTGSTFTVLLPCKEQEASAPESDTASISVDKPLIVIVEDNVQMSQFLETVLSEKYKCVSSSNGKSGLKLCKDVIPDLIIADVMMPVMDGLEMCRHIRACKPLSLTPIILLTALGDVETEKKSIGLNINDFIPKPFDLTLLMSKIDQLIGNKQRIEQKLRLDLISVQKIDSEISQDERFIKKVTQLIEEHLDDFNFSVGELCRIGGYNEKQLYRKVKQMTGLSTAEYIRSIRLKKAAILLQNGNFTISEVMYSVGFSNASYFTRAFSSEFGKSPSEYKRYYSPKV